MSFARAKKRWCTITVLWLSVKFVNWKDMHIAFLASANLRAQVHRTHIHIWHPETTEIFFPSSLLWVIINSGQSWVMTFLLLVWLETNIQHKTHNNWILQQFPANLNQRIAYWEVSLAYQWYWGLHSWFAVFYDNSFKHICASIQ